MNHEQVSRKTIGRLSLYRRLLQDLEHDQVHNVFSHQLALAAGVTSAQLRRDLMPLGCPGSPAHGYDVHQLRQAMDRLLDADAPVRAGLVGVGNLGRAVLSYFSHRQPSIDLRAAFDADPERAGRLIGGTPCYPVSELARIVRRESLTIGIVSVPPGAAQSVADQMIRAGMRGILNFAPVSLHVPSCVFVEDIDILQSLEKIAYFARQNEPRHPHLEPKGVAL